MLHNHDYYDLVLYPPISVSLYASSALALEPVLKSRLQEFGIEMGRYR